MAFAQDGATRINFKFQDRDKNTATLTCYAPDAVVQADIVTWATTVGGPTLQAVSDATIVTISVVQDFSDAAAAQAVEGSDVERKGQFVFPVAGSKPSIFSIPSFLNTKVIDGSNIINTADSAVIAVLAMFEDTGLFDTVGLGNYRGEALLTHEKAPIKVHRKSDKG